MSLITTVRPVVFVLAFIFGVVVLALCADLIANVGGDTLAFQSLGLSVGIINIVSIPLLMISPAARRHTAQLPSLGITTILWIAESALVTDAMPPGGLQCEAYRRFPSWIGNVCREIVAIQALSFITWIILLLYIIFVVVMCATGRESWQGGAGDSSHTAHGEAKGSRTYAAGV
ncbi:hypothetical protein VNI00_014092 [Paramarasmius palmivorus]|uniref:MARVEL domain-containing protein n=1 Tax=Paramarasmius palmivorus TaxID=297713 RepID=A0AAW0BU48_9AGAR